MAHGAMSEFPSEIDYTRREPMPSSEEWIPFEKVW